MHVYPVMRQHLPDGEQAVKHDTEEHKQIERTLKDLGGVDASDARFTELVRSLQATLADHIADEENEQFPQLRARVPAEKLVELAAKVDKKLAPTRRTRLRPTARCFTSWLGRVWV